MFDVGASAVMMSGEGEGERASRPTSLVLDGPQPQREPLKFDVNLIGAPPEVEQLVNNIKQVAEEFLYHWKTFPIVLPPSRFTGPGNKPADIIVPPSCDELDAAALDAGTEPQLLSPKQLHSIREKGEFEVASRHFPGQTHVWRVAGWLQRGRARARDSLHGQLARALALVVVVARDRLLRRRPLSLRAAAAALRAGLRALLDLLLGMPSMEAKDLERRIREERSRYLVAELVCKPEHEQDVSALAAWVSRAMRRAAAEKGDGREAARAAPAVPCLYSTPARVHIDLRLYRRDVLRRAHHTLQALLEREARGWFLHFRERHAALLASRKVPLKDIEEEVREAAMGEYVSRVCTAVRGSEALAALGAGVPELLAAQLRATAAVGRAEEGVRRRLAAGLAAAEARLRAKHPILSRADAWRRERLDAAAERLRDELRWAAHEDAAAELAAQKLHQQRYFLARDLSFLREREPLLAKELGGARSPTRRFAHATRVWRAARWRVTRHQRGRAEAVRTALAARGPPAPAPRSDPAQPVYLVRREAVREVSTRWPGWRLANLCHRAWSWTWNVMYVLGVVVPWCSPLALRSLLCVRPFVPEYELSQADGSLVPKRSSETPTMWSRLLDLWRHVARERRRFDTEPDTGLVGKGMSRAAHRVWQYGCVGGLGSLGLLLGWPVCCVLSCALSAAAAALAPLWVPPLALLYHAGCALVYDADCPRGRPRWAPAPAALLAVCVLGVGQAVLALCVAALCAPAAVLWAGAALVWEGARGVWERAAWRALAGRARVPARAGAACRRVAGPGLRAPPALRIRAAPALAALVAKAEADALTAWAADAERLIERPLRDYRNFVEACFGPFSVQIAETGPFRGLQREVSEVWSCLRAHVSARRAALACPLSPAARRRVRMTPDDLAAVIGAGGAEVSGVWGAAAGAPEWWAARGLDADDWAALAANTLAEAFDPEILVPLEEGAAWVALEAGPGARAWEGRGAAPPDVVAGAGAAPAWGGAGAPRVPPPSLEVGAFNPRLAPHPPLPPPALVALYLHNRDSDNPVPLDSELCSEILKTLEDAPDCDEKRDSVERYRGGASSTSSSEGGSDDERSPAARAAASPRAGAAGGGACRWTLTGRGVRLRADLASPEDVSLDLDRRGTSV